MVIKVSMDEDLYEAAEDVLRQIEALIEKDVRTRPVFRRTNDEILGAPLARAYERWQALAIAKYVGPPPPVPEQATPASRKSHPWRARARRVP